MAWHRFDWLAALLGKAAKVKADHDAGKTAEQIKQELRDEAVAAALVEAEKASHKKPPTN